MVKNAIHYVDLRGKTLVDLLRGYPDKANEIIKAASSVYGIATQVAAKLALPYADKWSHAWLKASYNPYLYEIESFADIVETPGVVALNLSYEWACTSGAYRVGETVSMLRVMDWAFPALGKHLFVALQSGKAGEFYNITWPALAGVYNAMAPKRFAAAINLAPMRRHGKGYIGDWLANRALMKHEHGLPPSHLLRKVFEQAKNYQEAKQMLAETPIAVPVIFTLTGIRPGEGCVIERLERRAHVHELAMNDQVSTANHFNSVFSEEGKGWRARPIDSEGRYAQSCAVHGFDLVPDHFEWLRAPILNKHTRLCMIADAASGRLLVQGFEGVTAVSDIFNRPAAELAQWLEVV